MGRVCAGIKRDGGRCTQGVPPGETWCYNHDPGRAQERKRAASRAGRSRPAGREVAECKRLLDDIVAGVLQARLKTGHAAVAIQAINAKRGLLDPERRVRETEELERRIAGLEERYGRQSDRSGTRGGARGR